jgi:hypothetical protein
MDKRSLRGSRVDGGQSGRTRFVVSTDREARDGHVVDQQSWILDGYRSNPVVLWSHDYDLPPIGRAVSIGVEGGALVAEVEWDTATDLGASVARQYDEGWLNAVSVGWSSRKITPRSKLPKEHAAYSERGLYFEDNEMLEFSAVSVPADANALAIRGLPQPRPERMSIDELADWLDATRAPRAITAADIAAALRDEEVRDAILRLVWSHEIPGESDWVASLEDDTDDLWR